MIAYLQTDGSKAVAVPFEVAHGNASAGGRSWKIVKPGEEGYDDIKALPSRKLRKKLESESHDEPLPLG